MLVSSLWHTVWQNYVCDVAVPCGFALARVRATEVGGCLVCDTPRGEAVSDVAVPCGFVQPWRKVRLRESVPFKEGRRSGGNKACVCVPMWRVAGEWDDPWCGVTCLVVRVLCMSPQPKLDELYTLIYSAGVSTETRSQQKLNEQPWHLAGMLTEARTQSNRIPTPKQLYNSSSVCRSAICYSTARKPHLQTADVLMTYLHMQL